MTDEKIDKVIALLQEMRDAQAVALERQARQVEISEKTMARADEQYERAARLTSKAEALQDRGFTAIKWVLVLGVVAIALVLYF